MSPEDTPPEDTPSEDTPPADGNPISARDALDYATDDEMLKLYGVIALGWVGMLAGQFALAAMSPLLSLVGLFVVLGGALAFLAGIVAIVRKLLVESS